MTVFQSYAASENFRLARSKSLYDLDDDTYDLIMIPKFAFVNQVWLYITQAYAGGASGTITVGFKGNGESEDAVAFMNTTVAAGRAAGMKIASDDTEAASNGKWFTDASGFITITLSHGTDTTLFRGYVIAQYSVLH